MGRIKKRSSLASVPPRATILEVEVDDLDDATSSASEPIAPVSPTKSKTAARRRRKKSKSQIEQIALNTLRYSIDVLSKILSLLKWPIAIFLTIALGRTLLARSISRVTGALQSQARSSICSLPFAAPFVRQAVPGFCEVSESKLDFNDLIEAQRNTVKAATVSVYSGSLPLQLKKAEMATSDLRSVLQLSDLSCKNSLDDALHSFSLHARDSSRHIQKTVVRVGGLLDASLAMNEWAVSALGRADGKRSTLGGLIPFIGRFDTRTSVTTTYIQAMDELSEYLRRLIESNQQAYESLDMLEEDLHLIHEIVGLEQKFQKTEQGEVLSNLWSFLGGNKKLKAVFKANLASLDSFERGRVANKEVVAATSVAFTKMMLEIEHLRERVQRPGLTGDDVPIEMHIRNIELGIEDLRARRDKSRKDENEDLLLD